MQSLKCPHCNLVNFTTDESCKRCKKTLTVFHQRQSINQLGNKSRQHFSQQKLSTVCPRCSSNDTQSFQMAYQIGTSIGTGNVATYNEELGVSVSSVSTSNQTILASQVKPPIEPNFTGALITVLLFVGVVFLGGSYIAGIGVPYCCSFFLSEMSLILLQLFVVILTFVISALILIFFFKSDSKTSKQIKDEYEININNWLKSWICLRCGTDWTL
jgi:phage FluMu protein Com